MPEFRALQAGVAQQSGVASLFSAFAEAVIATRPKSESVAILKKWAEVLADRELRDGVIVPLRQSDRDRAVEEAAANTEAVIMFRTLLQGCIARLNEAPMAVEDDT